jgi:hypothetical protein
LLLLPSPAALAEPLCLPLPLPALQDGPRSRVQ